MGMDEGAEGGDGADGESLMPHSHAVLGLKVADAEEEETVKRLAVAVLGLIVLLFLHFVVHVAHHGHLGHAVMHLLTAAVLPAVGYVAIAQRSTKAAWTFHVMTVISSVIHAVMLIVVLLHVAELQAGGPDDVCSKFAKQCEGSALEAAPMSYSPRQDFWRCASGYCIESSRHCDGEVNCFDHSDEQGCFDASALSGGGVPTQPPRMPGKDMERCLLLRRAQVKAPKLKWWWLLMSLPMWALCIFAAYHSLEFYVQLRIHRLSARVGRATADATVFDRAEVAE